MKTGTSKHTLEVWGGIECTINRHHDVYKDQLALSDHYNRPGDLEAFAGLGIKAIRYPVLWEKHCPEANKEIDWQWSSRQLLKIRELNLTPIVGLLHHGSGPAHTSLLDPNFPVLLADYAGKVASHFSWVEYYTPVNEPLTTARFSGLYGLWYPHATNEFEFLTMLLNQVKGIVLSMQAIRSVNPSAKLVQTEDIGKTHSTRKLKYQARFENHRRWITYDLLCGKVNERHALWEHFLQNGIPRSRLDFFLENICAPDIVGFNYYVTSERYLNEHIHKFPNCLRGNNGRHSYADNEAVRFIKPAGIKRLIREGWKRYNLPIAITEAHLNCSREDQLRWFKEIWDDCACLQKKGVELKAVTAWSLLGAYDWDRLLTSDLNNYETGVFDIRNNYRRPTAMVGLIRSLAATGHYCHPILDGKGWWHRHNPVTKNSFENTENSTRPLLIIGKNGPLDNALEIICDQRGIGHIIFSGQDIDMPQHDIVKNLLDQIKPWGIINATGYTHIVNSETAVYNCFTVNTEILTLLARYCKKEGIHFMHFSTDMMFIGETETQNTKSRVCPVNCYEITSQEIERAIITVNPAALIIRTSTVGDPGDMVEYNPVINGQTDKALNNIISPLSYIPNLVNTALDLFIDGAGGTCHISNTTGITRFAFAIDILEERGIHQKR